MRPPDSSNPELSPASLALVRDAEERLREVGASEPEPDGDGRGRPGHDPPAAPEGGPKKP